MKKVLTITLIGIAVAAMALINPDIKWEKTELILGEIKKGELVELNFSFTNDGTTAIKILEAKGSCGCTEVAFTREEIQPGESAEITAKFKSEKVGPFNKTVTVSTTGEENPTVLKFRGTIVE